MKSLQESIIGKTGQIAGRFERVEINKNEYYNQADYINDMISKNRYYGPVKASVLRKCVPLRDFNNPHFTPEATDWLTIGTDLRWEDLTDKDIIEVSPQEAYDLSYDKNGRAKNNPGQDEYILMLKDDGTLAGRILGGKWVVSYTLFKNNDNMNKMKKLLNSNPQNLKFYHIPEFRKWATDCLLHSLHEL